jgi:hypothetical protein
MNTDASTLKVSYDGSNLALKTADSSYKLGSIGDFNTLAVNTLEYHPWGWPSYVSNRTVYRESKFDVAFKIVEKLMDKGHIKELTVKEFTKLVKEIADTL